MKRNILFVLLWLTMPFLSGCGQNETVRSDNETSIVPAAVVTIYAIGDSITAWYQLPQEQSWPAQLEALLYAAWYKNYKVVNAWKSWDTSQQVKDRLDRSTSDAKKGDIAVVTIGWNDWFQSVPVATLANNIRDIILYLQWKWMIVVVWWMQITTNLWQKYITDFREIYPAIAKETGITLIPFILDNVALKPGLNLSDMIHPNQEGYAIVAKTVFDHLQENELISQ